MKDLIEALYKSGKFYLADLQVKVMPAYQALAVSGYVALKKYATEGHEEQTAEIKKELKTVSEQVGIKTIIEVNMNPSMKFSREMAHAFSVTQKFDSNEEKQGDVKKMREAGMISAHTYPLSDDWRPH